MNRRRTKALLSHISELLVQADEARHEAEKAKARADERRRVLSGVGNIWHLKRGEWLGSRGMFQPHDR
jgi:hypothetical protein